MSKDSSTGELRSTESGSYPDSVSNLLDGYPDAAVMVDAHGNVTNANEKGASLKLLLDHGQAAAVPAMIEQAVAKKAIVVGPVLLKGQKGEVLLEISVIPQLDEKGVATGAQLVLSHDVTMERNLRTALVESRQRYKDLVEVSSDFAWEVGADGTFSFVSPGGAIGYTADQLVGKKPEDLVADADQYDPLPFHSDRPMDNVEVWMISASGKETCVLASCLPLSSNDGEWHGARGVCRDITEDRNREAALRNAQEREQLLGYIVNSIRNEMDPLSMLTNAASATCQALGAAGCRIYRRMAEDEYLVAAEYGDTQEIEGMNGLLGRLAEELKPFVTGIGPWGVLSTATHYRQEINGAVCIWKADNEEGGGNVWHSNMEILIGDVANQIGIANEQIANHERIINLSRTDSMTGLLNRRAFFEEELPRRFKRLEYNGQSAALMYLDMDNFKRVNDIHGHQRGDEAIMRLRDMLLEYSRPGDAIVRMGGDEFALWMDGIAADVASKRVSILLEASKCLAEYSGDDEHPLGVSIGVALYDPISGENMESLVARADAAMYMVKNDGKGGFRIAEPAGNNSNGVSA